MNHLGKQNESVINVFLSFYNVFNVFDMPMLSAEFYSIIIDNTASLLPKELKLNLSCYGAYVSSG